MELQGEETKGKKVHPGAEGGRSRQTDGGVVEKGKRTTAKKPPVLRKGALDRLRGGTIPVGVLRGRTTAPRGGEIESLISRKKTYT